MSLVTETPPTRFNHRLFAYAYSDEQLLSVSSKRLIWLYEKKYISAGKHLKGFRGDYYWKNAAIEFALYGDAIPEFGLLASNELDTTFFIYYQNPESDGACRERYFFNRFEIYPDRLPYEIIELRKSMLEQRRGILFSRTRLEDFIEGRT